MVPRPGAVVNWTVWTDPKGLVPFFLSFHPTRQTSGELLQNFSQTPNRDTDFARNRFLAMYTRYPEQQTMSAPSATPMRVSKKTHSLFPTFDSIDEAEEFAFSRLPVSTQNDMLGILRSYENTVLATCSFDSRS